MKNLCDYHVHTTFSDGKNTPEEMVRAAINKGMSEIGFSDHSYVSFDDGYTIKHGKVDEYKREIARLEEKYRDKIKILCGIEQDFYSEGYAEGFDYVIGSVHYVNIGGKYLSVDETEEIFVNGAKNFFGGDYIAFAEEYFNTVAKLAERRDVDIVGHFDLIAKYNENNRYFDENNNRYVAAWKKVADKLIAANKTFEINTGAISRGYRTEPYPSAKIREYITSKGGKFILSSDSHSAEYLCYYFDEITD